MILVSRLTKPHSGYGIIKSWRDSLFSSHELWSTFFNEESEELVKTMSNLSPEISDTIFTRDDIADLPGPFFIVTSNVDAHSQKSGFKKTEVYQIHGNTEVWQCLIPCSRYIWKAPDDFVFEVDRRSMLSPVPEKFKELDSQSRKLNNGFASGHPVCINPNCNALARPAILMFGDLEWAADDIESDIYTVWSDTVRKLLKNKQKLVILEIGCGNRIPSIRYKTEGYLLDPELAPYVTLVRVNPDFPFEDNLEVKDRVIPIMGNGLSTVQTIDKHLQELLLKKSHEKDDK